MIFLGNLTLVEGTKYMVGFQHNMPFDAEHGIRDTNGVQMTEAQLLEMGVLVDSVPDPIIPDGQILSGMYVDKSTKEVTYTYIQRPLTDEEKMANMNTDLLQTQDALNSILGV